MSDKIDLDSIKQARAVKLLPWSHLSSPTARFEFACEVIDYLLAQLDAVSGVINLDRLEEITATVPVVGRPANYTMSGQLPTIEEMSGSINYDGRMIINEDNEPAIEVAQLEGDTVGHTVECDKWIYPDRPCNCNPVSTTTPTTAQPEADALDTQEKARQFVEAWHQRVHASKRFPKIGPASDFRDLRELITEIAALLDRSHADGYNNGFRHGKQSRQPIDYLPVQHPEVRYTYEDQLPPDMPKEDYEKWYAQSFVPNGIGFRVGPAYPFVTAEVEQLKDEIRRLMTHLGHSQAALAEARQKLATARADTIGEAIEVVKHRHPQVLGEIPESDEAAWTAARSYLEAAHESLLAALEQLKGEGK